ncbi:MAG: helix-turn-helix transcriptional regulator [Myxococcota bacterium]
MTFADQIKEARKAARLSQAAAAKRAGVSRLSWHRIENGIADPHLSTVRRICAAFDISIKRLPADDNNATDQRQGVA